MPDERSALHAHPSQPDGVQIADAVVTAVLANDHWSVISALEPFTDPVVREAVLYLAVSLAQLWERCEDDPQAAWAQALLERELIV